MFAIMFRLFLPLPCDSRSNEIGMMERIKKGSTQYQVDALYSLYIYMNTYKNLHR